MMATERTFSIVKPDGVPHSQLALVPVTMKPPSSASKSIEMPVPSGTTGVT